ncbi:hypothetical protein EJ110_NYTH34780 [Nymphaea thermarum]|nr:hypothetical protein EJ110_NYTH34780 [Nymphaea thermarum]
MLRGCFPILKMQVQYPFKKQVQIVLATCVLHNFIIEHNPNAEQFVDEDAPSNDNFVVRNQKLQDNKDEVLPEVLCRVRREGLIFSFCEGGGWGAEQRNMILPVQVEANKDETVREAVVMAIGEAVMAAVGEERRRWPLAKLPQRRTTGHPADSGA